MSKKRVVFCTNASLCSSLILERLLSSDSIEVVGIFLSGRVRTKSGNFLGDIYRIIKISGVRYAIYLALGTLFFECLSAFNGSYKATVKSIAKTNNIDTFANKDINSAEAINWLRGLAPDILFSGFFNQKLEAEALSIPSIACLNLHPALLPKYKGVDPVFYYFLNNEQTLGVTLHRMDDTYDTGEILDSLETGITEKRSLFWHNTELFRQGVELLLKWVEKPKELSNSSDSKENEFYDSWPSPQQVKQLQTPLFSLKDFQDLAKN